MMGKKKDPKKGVGKRLPSRIEIPSVCLSCRIEGIGGIEGTSRTDQGPVVVVCFAHKRLVSVLSYMYICCHLLLSSRVKGRKHEADWISSEGTSAHILLCSRGNTEKFGLRQSINQNQSGKFGETKRGVFCE